MNRLRPFPRSSAAALANVLFAGLQQGAIGIYQVVLQLSAALPTNPQTQLTISQNIYTSNIVTIPVFAPSPGGGN